MENGELNPCPRQGEPGEMLPGQPSYPTAKASGDKSMTVKRRFRANMPDPTPRKTRAIWLRMNCLNPSLQRWKFTSHATACKGADGRIGWFSSRRPKLPLPSDGQRGRSRGRTGDLRRAVTFNSCGHGIAFGPRGPWRRSGHSSPGTGKPFTWRRTAGALMVKAER